MLEFEFKNRGPSHRVCTEYGKDNQGFLKGIILEISNALAHLKDNSIPRETHLGYKIVPDNGSYINWEYRGGDDDLASGPGLYGILFNKTEEDTVIKRDDFLIIKQAMRIKRINGSYVVIKFTEWYLPDNSEKIIEERLKDGERYGFITMSWSGPLSDFTEVVDKESLVSILQYWLENHPQDKREKDLLMKFINPNHELTEDEQAEKLEQIERAYDSADPV